MKFDEVARQYSEDKARNGVCMIESHQYSCFLLMINELNRVI